MPKRGIATFTLDYGKCPPWLFERMVKLSKAMIYRVVDEYGPDEFVKRVADPAWFQSLGTVLAFDWNASGLTTILTAALKEAIKGQEKELGVFIAGGKGKTSRKTPREIRGWGEVLGMPEEHVSNLEYNSRMSAKVDSSLVQDGYQIYHHSFFFSRGGHWTVVQQGMNTSTVTARRYHWYSEKITDLINEPHAGIESPQKEKNVLNLTASESSENRDISTELVQSWKSLDKDIRIIRKHASKFAKTIALSDDENELVVMDLPGIEFGPEDHPVADEKFWDSPYLEKILQKLASEKPESYESLLATEGVGPKTIRALSLVAEVIYGAKPSYEDPARYSYAHGGKDATPFPVDRETYDGTIETLKKTA